VLAASIVFAIVIQVAGLLAFRAGLARPTASAVHQKVA
jgi:hypothetical protein